MHSPDASASPGTDRSDRAGPSAVPDGAAPDGAACPTSGPRLRRLPWTDGHGHPAYTPDDSDSALARLADTVEAQQLAVARTVLRWSRGILDHGDLTADEHRFLACRLVECLHDALAVVDSRGGHLPSPRGSG